MNLKPSKNPDVKYKTLRDELAGIALLGLLNNVEFPIKDIPEHAYRIADEMLEERYKQFK